MRGQGTSLYTDYSVFGRGTVVFRLSSSPHEGAESLTVLHPVVLTSVKSAPLWMSA